MKKPALRFKKISISKIQGFPSGLAINDELADNINIICGPNASGKSSTARLIQKFIWRHDTKGIFAEASAKTGDDKIDIKIDSEQVKVQRNGNEDELTGIPSEESAKRYMLALHELIKDSEEDLAAQIAKESIGGYDLEKAKKELNYGSGIRPRSSSEYRNAENAIINYNELTLKQKELAREEESLKILIEKREISQKASLQKDFYEKMIEYLEAKQEYDLYQNKKNEFPDILGKINGEEYSRITELEKENEKAEKDISDSENAEKKHENDLANLSLPKEGVDREEITILETDIEKLEKLETSHSQIESRFNSAKIKTSHALKNIDENIDAEKWSGIELEKIGNLEEFLDRALKTYAKKLSIETKINDLEKQIDDNTEFDLNKLNEAIRSLSLWLSEPGDSRGFSKKSWVLTAIIGLASAIITFFTGWMGIIAGIVALLVMAIIIFKGSKPQDNLKNVREKDFLKTGLTAPRKWALEEVSERLHELIQSLKNAELQNLTKQHISFLKNELAKMEPEINTINDNYRKMREKLHAMPALPIGNTEDYSSTYWFIVNIKQWQENFTETEVLKKELNSNIDKQNILLQDINRIFEKFDFSTVNNSSQAKEIFKILKEKEDNRRSLCQEIRRQKEKIDDLKNKISENSARQRQIYDKLEVEFGQKEKVLRLVEQLEEYKPAVENFQRASAVFSERENRLKVHVLYSDNKEDISSLDISTAKIKAEEYKSEAEKVEELSKQITEIRTKVQSSKEGNELEEALTEKESALDDLEDLYTKNLSLITGDLIVDHLKQTSQTQNRPKVFRQANVFFNKITGGRYELLLEDKGAGVFRAYDTVLRSGQDLKELSTGTRIQLILSVRLAYIETQESSLKLPLLADELLANSDDIRAKTIIDALTEICNEGRQVFYFTAQADEVAKWITYLENYPGIESKIIRLGEKTEETPDYTEIAKKFTDLSLEQSVSAPKNNDHEEYGKILKVPAYRLDNDNPEELHLWYLIEDNEILYNCLKRNIKQWGQLKSFINHNGRIEKLEESVMGELHEKISILERFSEMYKKGRPRQIDRSVIEDSQAVSDAFIEDVSAKMEELDKNPLKLIEALENNEVPRFRTQSVEKLKEYLIEQKYIDEQEPMSLDDIMLLINAFISNLKTDTASAEKFLGRLLIQQDF